jgi:hypothetical protein
METVVYHHFPTALRDRVQVETVVSMVKRRLEPFVRSRNAWSQRRELRLKVLTHNVMILLRVEVFYTASRAPFRRAICAKAARHTVHAVTAIKISLII